MPTEAQKSRVLEWAKILVPLLLASGFFGGREILESGSEAKQAAVVDTFKEAAYEWEVKFHLMELDLEDTRRRLDRLEEQ